jgi:hypothetical protein
MSLDTSYRSEGPSLATVSIVVGFGSFSTSPSYQSNFGGACLAPQLRLEGSSQPIFTPSQVSGVAELGERLCSSASVSLVSKSFQKYYRKANQSIWIRI